MSDYQNYKKAALVSVLKKLEIHTTSKDTKKTLVDKLSVYVADHPEDGILTIQSILEEDDDEKNLTILSILDEAEDEKTLNDEAEAAADAETAEEDDDDDEEEDDDEKDIDYEAPPPLSLKEWVVDPIIDKSEVLIQKVYDFTDSVGITYLDYSDELRERLSKAVTLNFAELLAEVLYFYHTFVPYVALKDNVLNQQLFKDNVDFLATSTLPTPDFSALVDPKVGAVFVSWLVTAVVLPLIVSYYINFSKRVLVFDGAEGLVDRIYRYDPFIFALSKVLVFYFVKSNGSVVLNASDGILNAVANYVLISFGYYGQFVHTLGNFPVAVGLANVAIALYSQFEDY